MGAQSDRFCYDGPAGTNHVGACRSGTQFCMGTSWFPSCSGQVVPQVESCADGVDNDCDGQVDEGCPPSLTPASIRILTGDTFAFTVTSGTAPYVFSMAQAGSGGSVGATTGLYTSGATAGTDEVRVTDANTASATSLIEVVQNVPLFATPSGGTAQWFDRMQLSTAVNCVLSATVDGQSRAPAAVSLDTYSLDLMLLSSGTYPVVVTTSCPGARTRTETYTFVVDRDPPAAPVLNLAGGLTHVDGGALVVAGQAEPGAQITVSLQPAGQGGSAFSSDGGAFAVPIAGVINGQHLASASAVDLVGNRSADSAPALVTITGGQPAGLSAWSVESSMSAGQTIQVYARGGTPPYSWSLPAPVNGSSVTPTGAFFGGDGGTSNLQLTDSADASVAVPIVVLGAMSLSFQQPLPGAMVAGPNVLVTIESEPNTMIDLFVDGSPRALVTTGPGTSGSAMLNLTPGVHELRADARSMFTGQVASRTISITVY